MERCPELFELEAFFEASAIGRYEYDGGWFYDCLRFETRLGQDDRTICTVEPAERTFSILYSKGGQVVIDVSLQHVHTLDIEVSGRVERLVGRVGVDGLDQMFKLSLRPQVSFHLGTALPSSV